PGFALVTIFVLALGIGATTAIFSVVDAVLIRPLPYAGADRLVSVANQPHGSAVRYQGSAPDFHDWHGPSTSFARLAMYASGPTSVMLDDAADYVTVTRATPEFFSVMDARPVLGRLPSAEEQRDGGPLTVVVSYAYWTTHLGGDASALGRTIKYRER